MAAMNKMSFYKSAFMKKIIIALRRKLLVLLTHSIALPVLKLVRKKKPFPYTAPMLRQLPAGTVGRDLIDLLDAQQLQLLPYYEKHDIKHVVLGFPMSEEGEACMQCFMLGNGRISFPVLGTVMYAYLTMPEYWGIMRRAYRKGKACKPLKNYDWFQLIPEPTSSVTRQIFTV
jgi:ubiquinone biosynthesis protein Coq4